MYAGTSVEVVLNILNISINTISIDVPITAVSAWDDADAIRDQLMEMKVTIQDTKDGSSWEIESS